MVVKIIRYNKPITQTLVIYASGRIITIPGGKKLPKTVRLFMDNRPKRIDKISGSEIWE